MLLTALHTITDTPGLQPWIDRATATHAYRYRQPTPIFIPYTPKVSAIGNGSTGSDIVSDYLVAGYAVVHSVAGPTSQNVGLRRNRGRELELWDDSKVLFESGEIEEGVDHCLPLPTRKRLQIFISSPIVHHFRIPTSTLPPLPTSLPIKSIVQLSSLPPRKAPLPIAGRISA